METIVCAEVAKTQPHTNTHTTWHVTFNSHLPRTQSKRPLMIHPHINRIRHMARLLVLINESEI